MVSGLLSYQGLRNGPQVTFQRTLKGPLGSQSLSVEGDQSSRTEYKGWGGGEWKTNCQRERRGRLE